MINKSLVKKIINNNNNNNNNNNLYSASILKVQKRLTRATK